MHITTRIVGVEDKEEKFEMSVKDKIKRIWRSVIFASDTSAAVWGLAGIEGKEKLYRQMMNLDWIVLYLRCFWTIYVETFIRKLEI